MQTSKAIHRIRELNRKESFAKNHTNDYYRYYKYTMRVAAAVFLLCNVDSAAAWSSMTMKSGKGAAATVASTGSTALASRKRWNANPKGGMCQNRDCLCLAVQKALMHS